MFLDGEISFFNSKAKIASCSAADKSLPSPLSVSRLISSEEDAQSAPRYPRVVIRGLYLKENAKKPKKSKGKLRLYKDRKALDFLLNDLFFDWFQFTIPSVDGSTKITNTGEDRHGLHEMFIFARRRGLNPLGPSNGNNGYGVSLGFTAGLGLKDTVMRISACSKTGIMPNMAISGGKGLCAKLAPMCQREFYGSSLSRADVAYDISQAGLYEKLYKMACNMSISNKKIGKPDVVGKLQTGLSFYVGSRKSVVRIKVYQKDMERANKGEINWCDADRDLVRIEITFRPQSSGKKDYFRMAPAEMVRTSAMARQFLSNAAQLMNITKTKAKLRIKKVERMTKQKTLESTVQHGFKQYNKAITSLAIKNIVEREFGGKVSGASIHPIKVMQEVKNILFAEYHRALDEKTIRNLIISERVEKPRSTAEDDVELVNRLYNFTSNKARNQKEADQFITHAQAQLRFDHKAMVTPEEIAVAKSIKRQNKKLLKAA